MKKFICVLVLALVAFEVSAQDIYSLLPKSKVSVKGTSTLHDWEVTSGEVQGNLEFEKKGKAGKGKPVNGSITKGGVTVVVTSLRGERGETMNGKMHRALKYGEYPTIHFELGKSFEIVNKTMIEGQLTIAGTTRQTAISAVCLVVDGQINISAEETIKMSDFGIEPPTAMFGQIVTGDEVTLDLKLFFTNIEKIK